MEYYIKNRDKILQYQKEYIKNNRQKVKQYQHEYFLRRREQRRDYTREYSKQYMRRILDDKVRRDEFNAKRRAYYKQRRENIKNGIITVKKRRIQKKIKTKCKITKIIEQKNCNKNSFNIFDDGYYFIINFDY